MQVLKESDPVKCSKCGCTFTFSKYDIVNVYDYSHLFHTYKYTGVKCPACEAFNKLYGVAID